MPEPVLGLMEMSAVKYSWNTPHFVSFDGKSGSFHLMTALTGGGVCFGAFGSGVMVLGVVWVML